MPQDKIKRIHLIYGLIVSVLILAVGIGLILSCLDIYHSGDAPYSRESIAARWTYLAPLAWCCIAAIAGGILLTAALPLEKQRSKAVRDDKITLRSHRQKAGVLTGADLAAVTKEHKLQKVLRMVLPGACVCCVIVPLIYFLDLSHFPAENLNREVAKAVAITLAAALVMLILYLIISKLERASFQRETAIYKKVIASRKGQTVAAADSTPTHKTDKAVRIARCVILTVAVCFIILGWFNGGVEDVLGKAIRICTECIGLG